MRAYLSVLFLAASAVWAESVPRDFHFDSLDLHLLEEANQIDQQFEKKGLIYKDPKLDGYLNNIGRKLIADNPPLEHVNFQFRLIRDPMVNAFALPNGSIYVNTGLISAMENESQLAGVLAHEITHVTNRHSYVQQRSVRKKSVALHVMAGISVGAGFVPGGDLFGVAIRSATLVSQFLVVTSVFGFNQELERDADISGMTRLTHANYNGNEMARAFEVLDERLEFEPVEPFWRTHPKLKERITTAKTLARAQTPAAPQQTSSRDYLARVAGVVRYNAAADIDSRRARTAVARMLRLIDAEGKNPTDVALLGDGYRTLGAKAPQPDKEELSRQGQHAVRDHINKLTAEEEQKILLNQPEGKAAKAENLNKAESLYKEAIAADPEAATAHRGLGMLYEERGENADAAREYSEYLRLAGNQAADRLRVELRVKRLTAQ